MNAHACKTSLIHPAMHDHRSQVKHDTLDYMFESFSPHMRFKKTMSRSHWKNQHHESQTPLNTTYTARRNAQNLEAQAPEFQNSCSLFLAPGDSPQPGAIA